MRKPFALFLALFALLLTGCAQASAETEVLVLKIGKADVILITSGEYAVLIDAGEAEDGEEILQKLATRNINSLDAMIITHFDKDHVGGADTVIEGIVVAAVYDANYEADSKQYKEYLAAIQATGIPRCRVSQDLTLSFGELSLAILPTALPSVAQGDMEIDNNQSVVVSMTDGNQSFFFAGDAEEARIEELLSNGISPHDVLKMPHHGQMKDNLALLLDAIRPSVAIITDSDKNPADNEVLNLLEEKKIKIYETRFGDILITSDKTGMGVVQ